MPPVDWSENETTNGANPWTKLEVNWGFNWAYESSAGNKKPMNKHKKTMACLNTNCDGL